MKPLVVAASLLLASVCVDAAFVPSLPYAEFFRRADLVVIGRPVSSRETDERWVLRTVKPATPVVGVTTEFQALLVFKGPKQKRFKLHHMQEQRHRGPDELVAGVPVGISFDIPKNRRYLMFLVRERDGRFAPIGEQQ